MRIRDWKPIVSMGIVLAGTVLLVRAAWGKPPPPPSPPEPPPEPS